mmetsp:Transcript_1451/g.1877  ORF Transcript_1451/g.1877 Transcript_1451/m.1877 type:complete len:124 (+) Transcript_1451:21-392(+)
MAESTPVTVESVEVPVDVTVSSPASFIGFAETKKPKDCRKNIQSCSVNGKVVTADGEEHTFKYANCSYEVDGTAHSSRKGIQAALGKVTYKDCVMNVDFAHRPWGFGGGGGGGGGGGDGLVGG